MANTVVFNFEIGDVVNVVNLSLTGKVTELSVNVGGTLWAYVSWMDKTNNLKGAWFSESELDLNG